MIVFISEIWKILHLFGIENPGGKICPLLKNPAKLGMWFGMTKIILYIYHT